MLSLPKHLAEGVAAAFSTATKGRTTNAWFSTIPRCGCRSVSPPHDPRSGAAPCESLVPERHDLNQVSSRIHGVVGLGDTDVHPGKIQIIRRCKIW